MKMTNNAMKRFEDMLDDFSKRYEINALFIHDTKERITNVKFEDGRYYSPCKKYVIQWDEAKSITDICVTIFVDLTVAWQLNTRQPKVDTPSVGQMLHETVKSYIDEKFYIKDVIFNDPATIVLWADGTKTVVKCQDGDIYSKETGLALCIAKKALGNKGNFNEVFKKWIPDGDDGPDGVQLIFDMPNISMDAIDKFVEDLCKAAKRRGLMGMA